MLLILQYYGRPATFAMEPCICLKTNGAWRFNTMPGPSIIPSRYTCCLSYNFKLHTLVYSVSSGIFSPTHLSARARVDSAPSGTYATPPLVAAFVARSRSRSCVAKEYFLVPDYFDKSEIAISKSKHFSTNSTSWTMMSNKASRLATFKVLIEV